MGSGDRGEMKVEQPAEMMVGERRYRGEEDAQPLDEFLVGALERISWAGVFLRLRRE